MADLKDRKITSSRARQTKSSPTGSGVGFRPSAGFAPSKNTDPPRLNTPDELEILSALEQGQLEQQQDLLDAKKLDEESLGQNVVEKHYKDLINQSSANPNLASAARPNSGISSSTSQTEATKAKAASTIGGSSGSDQSEKRSLSDTINSAREDQIASVANKIGAIDAESSKLGVRGRAKKRVQRALLVLVFGAVAAVPIGVIGLIPHAIQSWIEQRVSAYVERATDKIGKKILMSFLRGDVAPKACEAAYSSAQNSLGDARCTPRDKDKNRKGLVGQLLDDWRAGKMEDLLTKNGVNIEYRPGDPKPYRLQTKSGEIELGDLNSSDWDTDNVLGRRTARIDISRELKSTLKESTKWHQFLKRRNMKGAMLRRLNLPGRVFLPRSIAEKLDDRDAAKINRKTRFKLRFSQHVLGHLEGRTGIILEAILGEDNDKDPKKETVEENKAIRQAAKDINLRKGDGTISDEAVELVERYSGKELSEILIEIIERIIAKASAKVAAKVAQLLTALVEAVSVVLTVVGILAIIAMILELVDVATDGTLEKYISATNTQGLLDTSNLLDTMISEERRGFVDVASAGDMRVSLTTGLSSSRIFANTTGYKGSGKEAPGYECRANIDSFNSALEGIGGVFSQGGEGLDGLERAGMKDGEDTCENHRVDYNPFGPFRDRFDDIQTLLIPYTAWCWTPAGIIPKEIERCPSLQANYRRIDGFINTISEQTVGRIFSFLTDRVPFFGRLQENAATWINGFFTSFIIGDTLLPPTLIDAGYKSENQPGARLFDSYYGGKSATTNGFAKDGGGEDSLAGIGAMPMTSSEAKVLNRTIAQEKREEFLASSVFERIANISDVDSLASSFMATTVNSGGLMNIVNPAQNLALAFGGQSSDTVFADGEDTAYCSQSNRYDKAVDEFGAPCYAIQDNVIDGLSDDDLELYSDPDFCNAINEDGLVSNAEWNKVLEERGGREGKSWRPPEYQDPDGTGQPDRPNLCRAMCTVTDTMGTIFRTDDKICGYEDLSTSSGSGSAHTPLEGVECPAGSLETKVVGSTTYYKIPEDPAYNIYSRDSRRFGSQELVCILYTVGKAYKDVMGSSSTLQIGDLNAGAPHKSHKWGVGVDLLASGDVGAADITGSGYSKEATVTLGKLFIDTGVIKNIWWCPDDDSTEQILAYAESIGKPVAGQIKCVSGHRDHFHVDLIDEYRGADTDAP